MGTTTFIRCMCLDNITSRNQNRGRTRLQTLRLKIYVVQRIRTSNIISHIRLPTFATFSSSQREVGTTERRRIQTGKSFQQYIIKKQFRRRVVSSIIIIFDTYETPRVYRRVNLQRTYKYILHSYMRNLSSSKKRSGAGGRRGGESNSSDILSY